MREGSPDSGVEADGPWRHRDVHRLSHGQSCVCDLQALIGADMSTVSKHLSILKSAGIVTDEKRGAMVMYKLHLTCVLKFLGCVETILGSNAKEQMELSR